MLSLPRARPALDQINVSLWLLPRQRFQPRDKTRRDAGREKKPHVFCKERKRGHFRALGTGSGFSFSATAASIATGWFIVCCPVKRRLWRSAADALTPAAGQREKSLAQKVLIIWPTGWGWGWGRWRKTIIPMPPPTPPSAVRIWIAYLQNSLQ